jgi:hypothetical protein
MKTQIGTLDAIPSKRLFLSIIADYDLNRSICELIDNALDVWVRNGRSSNIKIDVTLATDQQIISVTDNAGGLKRSELRYVVGPGQTGSIATDETIGIFGVGTKRAVVALSQDIKITTRYRQDKTHEVDYDEIWLGDDDWQLPLYEVDEITPGTTIVELQKLRISINEDTIEQLRTHLGATYAKFLMLNAVAICVNDKPLAPRFFADWSYPPAYAPRRYTGKLPTSDGRAVRVEVVAGLSSESSPATGEYGVYFYCNDRLVAPAMKSIEVGFTRGLAGLPHPKISLLKVIVSLNGDAISMPWNSSKSDINTRHPVFLALHDWLVQVVKDYAALSRIWMGDWPEKVFRYSEGEIVDVPITDFPAAKKSFLPPLPKSRPRYAEIIAEKNKKVAKDKPWVKGLYEGVIAADLIAKQRLEQRNRIALIVLDSTLEIAFKEYLVNESGVVYNDAKLLSIFNNRSSVQTEIKKYVKLSVVIWGKIDHYYRMRNKLVHERVTVGVSDHDVGDFRDVVEGVLKRLFKLSFAEV